MNIYVGSDEENSLARFNAFNKAGGKFLLIRDSLFPKKYKILRKCEGKILKILGPINILCRIYQLLVFPKKIEKNSKIFLNQPVYLDEKLMCAFRKSNMRILLYINDNPFAERDGKRWRALVKSTIPAAEKVIISRHRNLSSLKRLNINVEHCFMPVNLNDLIVDETRRMLNDCEIRRRDCSVFIGTFMPGRNEELNRIAECGLNIDVYGPGWDKVKSSKRVRIYSGYVDFGQYVELCRIYKYAIILLSVANQDGHTTRTFEIPLYGGVPLIPYTADHRYIFGKELCYKSINDLRTLLESNSNQVKYEEYRQKCFERSINKVVKNEDLYKDFYAN